MIRIFQSTDRVEAIEFSDAEQTTIRAIIALTGRPITVDYLADGSVRTGVIKDVTNLFVVNLGQFVYRDGNGNIGACDYEYLTENYKEITEDSAA
ncbi:hypothetical protein DFP94_101558 [Fontibacillus phaseoli]|uniref:Uncharacterized protein n=1 Tax=Fontibacillus phaseoli TaxID=1416533 RepID=A0A369BMY3_9BACL|nr:hypothetical protein [Fontibacillus phaseoli]RCX22969.1 hypothetical protein DFP94_101558 [Fontibacillus phaseoli]